MYKRVSVCFSNYTSCLDMGELFDQTSALQATKEQRVSFKMGPYSLRRWYGCGVMCCGGVVCVCDCDRVTAT